MNSVLKHPDMQRVLRLVDIGIHEIEMEGGDVRIFAAAFLRAGAELFAETHDGEELLAAFVNGQHTLIAWLRADISVRHASSFYTLTGVQG